MDLCADLLVDCRNLIGECPTWDGRTGDMYWADLGTSQVFRLGADHPQPDVLTLDWDSLGAIALRDQGGLLVAGGSSFGTIAPGETGPQVIAHIDDCREGVGLNDGKCDAAGRFWAGTASRGNRDRSAALYRLDVDGRVTLVRDGIGMSNGLGWSPDHEAFYHTDTTMGRIDRFDFDVAAGTISGRTEFLSIPRNDGLPDGLTVDADGNVWVAIWGGSAVRCYAPDGRLMRTVSVPVSQVTSCTFGGDRLDILFITTARASLSDSALTTQPMAGGLFTCEPGVKGQAPTPFPG